MRKEEKKRKEKLSFFRIFRNFATYLESSDIFTRRFIASCIGNVGNNAEHVNARWAGGGGSAREKSDLESNVSRRYFNEASTLSETKTEREKEREEEGVRNETLWR